MGERELNFWRKFADALCIFGFIVWGFALGLWLGVSL